MAFENLDTFTERIAKKAIQTQDINFVLILVDYFETVLKNAKFKHQRQYCEWVIYTLNSHFYEGYFKKKGPQTIWSEELFLKRLNDIK